MAELQEIAYSPWLPANAAALPLADLGKPAAKLNRTDGTPMGSVCWSLGRIVENRQRLHLMYLEWN